MWCDANFIELAYNSTRLVFISYFILSYTDLYFNPLPANNGYSRFNPFY